MATYRFLLLSCGSSQRTRNSVRIYAPAVGVLLDVTIVFCSVVRLLDQLGSEFL
jgi:hypothetical protein